MPKAKTNKRTVKKTKKLPYSERNDLQKLASQWTKLTGLHDRDEASAAVIRCATAAEVAANLAIRHDFKLRTDFDAGLVDSFLFWANGLRGKIEKLFVPMHFESDKDPTAKALLKSALKINAIRNQVAHQGVFCSTKEAADTIDEAAKFINLIVGLSIPDFDIKTRKSSH